MRFCVFFIFTLIFSNSEVYCKSIKKIKPSKLSCNEVSDSEEVEDFGVSFYLSSCEKKMNEDNDSDEEDNSAEIKTGSGLKKFLKDCDFNPKLPTTVLVHGFINSHDEEWVENMKDALIKYKPMNLILVDWSDAFTGEDGLNYRAAALSTEMAADEISKMIQKMANASNTPLKNWFHLHFIGHSLGAHVVGQAARKIRDEINVTVHRVTGLDPAQPCFETSNTIRLRKTDAEFVDVIHTNSAPGKNPNLGSFEPLGHIDFYPNGGNHQPGCLKEDSVPPTRFMTVIDRFVNNHLRGPVFGDEFSEFIESASKKYLGFNAKDLINNFFESDYELPCDHEKAPIYFTRSLNPKKKYYGVPINGLPISFTNQPLRDQLITRTEQCTKTHNCVEMGINATQYKNTPGIYYVNTRKIKK